MNIKCIRCKEEKESIHFSKNIRSKTGHNLYCKMCVKDIAESKLKNIEYTEVKEKLCLHCRVIKPISEFSKNKRRKDGAVSVCKVCINNETKARYGETQATKIMEHYSDIFNNWDYTTEKVGVCKIPIFKYKKGDYLYGEPFSSALIDSRDLYKVKNLVLITSGIGYATLPISRTNRILSNDSMKHVKKKTLRLHEVVLGDISEEGLLEPYYTSIYNVVDHINGDILDNTTGNLRKCTNIENSYNRTKSTGPVPCIGITARRGRDKEDSGKPYWYFNAHFSGRRLFKERAFSEDAVYKIVVMREAWNVMVNGDFASRQILTKESRDVWLSLHTKNADWKEVRDFIESFYSVEDYMCHVDVTKKKTMDHIWQMFSENTEG